MSMPSPWRRLGLGLGGSVVAVGGVVATLVWLPRGVGAWLGGAVAAAFAGYLAQELPRALTRATERWRRRRGAPAPIVVTVAIVDEDYVVLVEGDRVVEVPASGHGVRLTVESVGDRPVLLTGLRPEVVWRGPNLGTVSRHAGAVPARRFEVHLDAEPPRVRPVPVPAGGDGTDFPYRVTPDDPEVIELAARTDTGDVRWVLHLDWVSDGQTGAVRIDLGGAPLRTAARHPSPQAA